MMRQSLWMWMARPSFAPRNVLAISRIVAVHANVANPTCKLKMCVGFNFKHEPAGLNEKDLLIE